MSDENVRDAIHGNQAGNPARGKLISVMMEPYTPLFMRKDVVELRHARPIDGMSPKTAEGIIQAIEQRLVTHSDWLKIHPLWQRIMATAKRYKPS
jgi:hypothetical protein